MKFLDDFKRFIRESKKSSLVPFSTIKKDFLDYAETNYFRHTKYLYEKSLSHFIRINGDLALEKITARHYDNYKVTLTAENVEALLNATERPWLRDNIIFAINTGMRRGELLSLRWCDVDTEHRIARIINRDDFTTKGGEERIIVLNDAAIAVINRCVHSKKHDYLFSREDGIRVMPDWLTAAFKSAVRKAGLPEGIHLIRQGMASPRSWSETGQASLPFPSFLDIQM